MIDRATTVVLWLSVAACAYAAYRMILILEAVP